jgi:hypothetical protein
VAAARVDRVDVERGVPRVRVRVRAMRVPLTLTLTQHIPLGVLLDERIEDDGHAHLVRVRIRVRVRVCCLTSV